METADRSFAGRMLRRGIAAALLVAVASPVSAGEAPSPRAVASASSAARGSRLEGAWQGLLLNYHLIVRIRSAAGGALSGTLDSPDQGAAGVPIDAVVLEGDTLRLDLHSIGASFSGAVEKSGDAVTGQWHQNGVTLPLTFHRGEGAAEMRKPQEPVPPLPYRSQDVTFENPKAKVRLAGTLTLPVGPGPFPAALLISGSGPEDRDEAVFGHRPFLVLSDYLTRRGIAVLRFDDRGVGGSTGSLANTTMTDLVDDALCGVAYLRARRDVDPNWIGLIGHSEGGMVGPAAAVRSNGVVSYLVLLAAPGVPGDSLILMQSAAIRKAAGASDADIAGEQALAARIYTALKAPGDSAAVAPAIEGLLRQLLSSIPEEQAKAMGGRDKVVATQMRALLSPWFRFMVSYDPRPTLTRVRCPVLALNGEKDQQVPPRENLSGIETALRVGGDRDVTIRELAGLNHLFQTCEVCTINEYPTLDETFAPAALDSIGNWIAGRAGAGAAAGSPAKKPAAGKPAAGKPAAGKPAARNPTAPRK